MRRASIFTLQESLSTMRILFWTTLCSLALTTIDTAAGARSKRAIAFRKGSTFFYRMNFKANVFTYTTIFAHAAGFKVVWPLPEGVGFGKHRSIRDIHESTELMYASHGLNGKACLMQNICQATEYVTRRDGVMAKIVKLLLGSSTENGTMNVNPLECGHYANQCPLQFIGFNHFSPYRR
ncbi:uncharacterized protein LOC117168298 [Belonocnema kinseyi]|uniref:uncharacterized protein LOC117168298 n=1 Tax=Belonocnema kinseyi TaxID=2817044 RepID=UPI00143CDFAC|nr:uncharacterized protein LOC117168298 [Belonocnema kinseyi]